MPPLPASTRRTARRSLLAALALVVCSASGAAQLLVRVSGLTEPLGQVACSLFAGAAGFPMDNTGVRTVWVPADSRGVTCRFADVPEGSDAVSIGHGLNGNQRVDTNVIGLPTEPWGILSQS